LCPSSYVSACAHRADQGSGLPQFFSLACIVCVLHALPHVRQAREYTGVKEVVPGWSGTPIEYAAQGEVRRGKVGWGEGGHVYQPLQALGIRMRRVAEDYEVTVRGKLGLHCGASWRMRQLRAR
jgi:hypothetical protein